MTVIACIDAGRDKPCPYSIFSTFLKYLLSSAFRAIYRKTLDKEHKSNQIPDLGVRAVDGVHEAALAYIGKYLRPSDNILDLGAGTGAWASKLFAQGYNLTCVDRDESGFAFQLVKFIATDLNDEFSKTINGNYEAITAIEVIEHLENPRHFLRQCLNLLAPEGILLITTPNIESVAGRLRFLYSGHFRMFDRDEKLNDSTHITPIQTFMFEKMAEDTGFRILQHESTTPKPQIVNLYARLICWLMSPFVRGFKGGDSHVFVLIKS
jgi:2-polyprenyl-3-methyl-5-hydroxy-6-metoxy-1,4-benzoquinol methylase